MCSGKPKIKFRSYNPQTEELKEQKLPKAKPEEGTQLSSVVVIICSLMTVSSRKVNRGNSYAGQLHIFMISAIQYA